MTYCSTAIDGWIEKIRRQLDSGALSDALAEIQRIVDYIFCEPINVARVFGAPVLDQLCQAIGLISLESNCRPFSFVPGHPVDQDAADKTNVYLVSRLQVSGGHTAALADVIRLSGVSKSMVIVTGTCGRSDSFAQKARFMGLANVTFEHAPAGSHLTKLRWIQTRLAQTRPSVVWLFNHHQDSVAIAAVQPCQGYEVRFYHHGDHHLCLGVHLDYAKHYDPHPMGFHNCRESLGIAANRYLPLVVSDQGERPSSLNFLGSGYLVTCTAAGANKVEVPYFLRYADVVPEVLEVTGGRHIHIGSLTWLARRRIKQGLRKRGIPVGSFVYVRHVPSVWRALHDYGVDLYLASFPYGGGRTLIEVMGAGVPAVIHQHCASRMLCGFDMAYEGAATWQTRADLMRILRAADKRELIRQGISARSWYNRYHRDEVLEKALSSQGGPDAPSLRPNYCPNPLLQALMDADTVTLKGVVYRIMLRVYRRWQAWLGMRV